MHGTSQGASHGASRDGSARRLRLEQELAGILRERRQGQAHGGQRDSVRFQAPPIPSPESVPTGIPEIDALTGGIPKGHITEISGMTSSGRTSLMLSVLAGISGKDEVAGLIDPGDAFDPASAAAFGVCLERLLWIRSGEMRRRIDPVLKIADLLVQGGGFGMIGVDLSDLPSPDLRRIPMSVWFRLQRAAYRTSTILLLLGREPVVKTTAALGLRMELAETEWSGRFPGRFLSEVRPGARILHSRYRSGRPSPFGREPRPFRLYPVEVAAAVLHTASGPHTIPTRPGGITP